MFDISKLYEPRSISEAIEMLQKHPAARILAGGSDLLLKIREGKLAGVEIVSIYKLDELRGVTMETDGTVVIRPLTSFSRVECNEIIAGHLPMLAEAAGTVGGPQIRNIGTVGGNVCNGATSADCASTLFAYGAELELTGPNGTRNVPVAEFYSGPGKVDLQPAEILTAIRVCRENYEGYYGKYVKYAMRNAMDISTLNCAVLCKLSANKHMIEDARIAFGVAAPIPMRCGGAEQRACTMDISEDTLDGIVEEALKEITPRSSWRASKELRMQLAKELACRALKEAVRRAGGRVEEAR